MKKLLVTAAILGALLTPLVLSPQTTAGRARDLQVLAPTPAPVGAGGGIATAIGLVGAPFDLLFALRGSGTKDFWQYSISRNTWAILPNTPEPVDDGGAIVQVHYSSCFQGELNYSLAVLRGGNTPDFWLYDTVANRWCEGPKTPAPVGPGGAITQLQAAGEIYALRGNGTTDFWKLDQSGTWKQLSNIPGPVTTGGGLVGINYGTHSPRTGGVLYAIQGGGASAVWRYRGDSDTWTKLSDTPAPVGAGGRLTTSNVGGGDEGTLTILQGGGSTKVWSLDINLDGNVWEEMNSAPTPVNSGGAIAGQVNGCNFALAGGGSNEFFSTGSRDCLVVNQSPDFSLHFAQPTVTTTLPAKIKVLLNIVRTDGFTGRITLVPVSPKVQGIVIPEEIVLPEVDSRIFKIKIKASAPKGSFPITFAGSDSSGKVRNATFTLVIE